MPTFHLPSPQLVTREDPRVETCEEVVATPFLLDGQGFSGALYDKRGVLIRRSQRVSGPSEKVYTTDPDVIPIDPDLPVWEGRGCYIGHVMNHYGHFITEGLASVWPAIDGEFDYLVAHPFIWGDAFPAYAHDALKRLGIESDRVRILTEPVRLRQVAIPDPLWAMNASVNGAQRRVISKIKRRFMRADPTLKLYLSRSRIPRRAVPNERQIEEVFRKAGFLIIQPQKYSFEAQLEIYGQASMIAGLAGSALHNIIFCSKGAGTISVGDKRGSSTVNQQVCGAFVDGPTGVIEYADDPTGFHIPTLESELRLLLESWPLKYGRSAPGLQDRGSPGAKPKRVLILGIGKSGTTALMTAISQSLGIPSEMEPRDLRQLDYDKSFVAKKLIDTTHDRELKYIARFDKVIFIVRDPRDALISRLLYAPYGRKRFAQDRPLKDYLDLVEQKILRPETVSVSDLIARLRTLTGYPALKTTRFVTDRMLRIHKVHGQNAQLLKYEDFIRNDFAAIDAYLGSNISSAFTVDEKYRRVARKGAQGDWKDWFTASDCAEFDEMFKAFYAAFGYAPEQPSAHPVIDRATSVDYIERLVNEWRARRDIPPYKARFARIRYAYAKRRSILASLRKSPRDFFRKASRRIGGLVPGLSRSQGKGPV